ncbi:MAG: hypothetical protein IJF07_08455 [Lachnospiraceae bacterium]|nr:hypothetical protein [Lachnospiraceae bacterium]
MERIDIIREMTRNGFSEKYKNFKEFQMDERYQKMWKLCMHTLERRDLLLNMIFCNDVYQIPPVRTFIEINREELELLREEDKEQIFFEGKELKTFIKQSIGAYWGMVFKYILGYTKRKTVSVVKEKNYGVQSASRFYCSEHEAENRKRTRLLYEKI